MRYAKLVIISSLVIMSSACVGAPTEFNEDQIVASFLEQKDVYNQIVGEVYVNPRIVHLSISSDGETVYGPDDVGYARAARITQSLSDLGVSRVSSAHPSYGRRVQFVVKSSGISVSGSLISITYSEVVPEGYSVDRIESALEEKDDGFRIFYRRIEENWYIVASVG